MKHFKTVILLFLLVLFAVVTVSNAQIYNREKIIDDGTNVDSDEATELGNDLINQYSKNEPANSLKPYNDDYNWENYNELNPDSYIKEDINEATPEDAVEGDEY